MTNSHQFVRPDADEIEVSVFGEGVGEALAVHIGDDNWLIVDSCYTANPACPAPLDYLRRIGVSVAEAVKLVIATHWHRDHHKGISISFRECTSAKFVMSSALCSEEIFVHALQSGLDLGSTQRDYSELFSVLQILRERKQGRARFAAPKWAKVDTCLYSGSIRSTDPSVNCAVFALSPSDAIQSRATLAIANRLTKPDGCKASIASPKENEASVALLVEVGDHRMLLGADLERSADPSYGWSAVLLESNVMRHGVSSVYKVPHHGSATGHDDRIWCSALCADPVAVLTPFLGGGKHLPAADDIQRIMGLTTQAYITAPLERSKAKMPRRLIQEELDEATASYRLATGWWNHVRLRQKIAESPSWRVELFDGARSLSAELGLGSTVLA